MCFAFDAHPPDLPADLALPTLAGGAAAELLELDLGRRHALLGRAGRGARGAAGPGVVILPDVRGLYRFYVELAERFAAGRPPRDRDRLLRAHRRHRRARRGLRLHAPRDADARRAGPGRRRRRDRARCASAPARARSSPSASASAARSRSWPPPAPSSTSTARSASTPASSRGARAPRTPIEHARRDALPGPRPVRRRRRGHPARAHRGLRARPAGGRRRARDRHLPGRAALVLRPLVQEHAEACEDAWRRVLGFLQHVGASLTR